MRILADENVSVQLVHRLRSQGLDVAWIREDHPSMPDRDILELATVSERIVLTFDSDFGSLVMRDERPAPFGIVYPRLKRLSLSETVERVFGVMMTISEPRSKIIVIEEDKVRIRTLANLQQDNP